MVTGILATNKGTFFCDLAQRRVVSIKMDNNDRKARGKRKGLKYIVIVSKPLPADLCERISKIHASAILQSRHADNEARKPESNVNEVINTQKRKRHKLT